MNTRLYPHSDDTMKNMLCRLFTGLGVPVSSHDFRHTKLTDLGEFLTPQQVRDYAAHSSIRVTDKYLHSNQEDVLKKVAAADQQRRAPDPEPVPEVAVRKRSLKRNAKHIIDNDNSDFHSIIAQSVADGHQTTLHHRAPCINRAKKS